MLLSVAALALAASQWPGEAPTRVSLGGVESLTGPARTTGALALYADFAGQTASPAVRQLADWVADSADNGRAGFVIVDKVQATVLVFSAQARLLGTSPVLLGATPGDDSAPGVGLLPLAQVLPEQRTTPAGRFVAERGHNSTGDDVVWVDYDAAVSMHRVRASNPAERRLERLATPGPDDNRISWGCINVPAAFYEAFIRPVFASQRAVVYVLPEHATAQQVFGSYDVAGRHPLAPRPAY